MSSRSFNSIINSIIGIISYVIVFISTFIIRRYFATFLGQEILGLNSLYTNIITFLSMAELGMSSAMVIFLYEPVAKKNKEKIKSYMHFYKRIYHIIFLFIFIVGLLLSAFIPFITKSTYTDFEVRWYFILFVINTCTTYSFAYKKSILFADQKNGIISIIHMSVKLLFLFIEVLVIRYTQSFTLYLICVIASNILENLVCNYYANRLFPCLLERNITFISKNERNNIFNVVKPMFVQRIANTFLTSSDNILVSLFVNINYVAVYSSYILIAQTVISLLGQVFASFTSSFGNLIVSDTKSYSYKVLCKTLSLSHFLITNACILYLVNIQHFIYIWLGELYVADFGLSLLVCLYLFFYLSNYTLISVQNAIGYHKYDCKYSVYQTIFNIFISIILTLFLGVNGVVIGTILSILLFPTITKPMVVFKEYYGLGQADYFRRYVKNFLQLFLLLVFIIPLSKYTFLTNIESRFLMNILNMVIKSVIALLITNVSFLNFYRTLYAKYQIKKGV